MVRDPRHTISYETFPLEYAHLIQSELMVRGAPGAPFWGGPPGCGMAVAAGLGRAGRGLRGLPPRVAALPHLRPAPPSSLLAPGSRRTSPTRSRRPTPTGEAGGRGGSADAARASARGAAAGRARRRRVGAAAPRPQSPNRFPVPRPQGHPRSEPYRGGRHPGRPQGRPGDGERGAAGCRLRALQGRKQSPAVPRRRPLPARPPMPPAPLPFPPRCQVATRYFGITHKNVTSCEPGPPGRAAAAPCALACPAAPPHPPPSQLHLTLAPPPPVPLLNPASPPSPCLGPSQP
jgi:hypothetical protein